MASIEKKNGKWAVRWHSLDGRHPQRTFPTKAAASAFAREVETCLALGRDWEPPTARRVVDLEEEVFGTYVDQASTRLGSRTLRRYAENLDLFLRFLRTRSPKGTLTPRLLSKSLLQDFHAWLLRPENGLWGRQRGRDTARKIVEVVQLAWAWADDSERWPGSIPPPRKIEMTRSPAPDVVAPSWQEMDACLRELTGWQWKLGVFLRYTGLRVAETMLLRWENINLSHGSVRIAKEISKTKRGRYIPLSPYLIEELSGWGVREGWVIPYDGRQERRKAALAKYFNAAWASAKVREEAWKGNSTKAFRKGFKSGMLNLAPAHADAIDYLQGHRLGKGSRSMYIDPWQALPLRETVALIPSIREEGGLTLVDSEAGVRAQYADDAKKAQ